MQRSCQLESEELQTYQLEKMKNSVMIRRENRQEIFQRKRKYHENLQKNREEQYYDKYYGEEEGEKEQPCFIQVNAEIIQALVADLQQKPCIAANSLTRIRQIVTEKHVCEIAGLLLIENNFFPKALEFIQMKECFKIQEEAVWCLANLSADDNSIFCHQILNNNGIEIILDILDWMVTLTSDYNYQLLASKFLCLLTNMVVGNTAVRDSLTSRGLDEILGKFFAANIGELLFDNVCETLSVLCRGDPLPDRARMEYSVQLLCVAILRTCFKKISLVSDILFAICHNCEGKIDSCVITSKMLQKILKIGRQNKLKTKILGPTLGIIKEISIGDVDCVNYLLSLNILTFLENTVERYKIDVEKKRLLNDVVVTTCNIISSCSEAAKLVWARKKLLTDIIEVGQICYCNKVKLNICLVFYRLLFRIELINIDSLFEQIELMEIFVDILSSDDTNVVREGLIILSNIFIWHKEQICNTVGDVMVKNLYYSSLYKRFEDNGGVERIEKLQYHEKDDIAKMASDFVRNFYQSDDFMLEMHQL